MLMTFNNTYMHNLIKYSYRIFLLLFVTISCQKEVVIDISQKENLEKVAESEFKRLQMPGIAYLAVKGDSIIHMNCKGYADIQKEKSFTPQTRMIIASISKTIAVTAIMQLYEKGLVSIDEDINNYLPFEVRNPNFPDEKITVKMLLTHKSSIVDGGYPQDYYLFGYVDYPEALMDFEKNYLTKSGSHYTNKNFLEEKPGSTYSYSNVAAALLACLVEHISGTDYNTYCKTNIFAPLGMTHTTWFFSETPKEEIAIPYGDNNFRNPKNPFFTYPTYPDGHLITTIEDLSKFMRAYIGQGYFNNFQLLKPQTVGLILQGLFNMDEGTQGLIFFQREMKNSKVWGHDGSDPGISTEMFFNKEDKTGYIIFINRSDAYSETLGYALLKYANQ
jgi:CubicO group peptidase (beta-lactamase class C family)